MDQLYPMGARIEESTFQNSTYFEAPPPLLTNQFVSFHAFTNIPAIF